MIHPKIFKAYDVRGVYGTELTDSAAFFIARALVQYIKASKIILGRDMRLSSPALHKAVIKGLSASNITIVDIGVVSTDCFYFACATTKLPGIMITASHNPKEYNGLKMVRQIPYLIGGGEGMEEIRELALELEAAHKPTHKTAKPTKPKIIKKDFTQNFVKKLLSVINSKQIKPLKVVADASNGMAGLYLEQIFKKLPSIKLTKLNFKPDGRFPNHGPNPLLEENQAQIKSKVLKIKADVGLIFDADADRFFAIDDKGELVHGDFLTAIFARQMLEAYPKAKIIHDVRASWAVRDTITQFNGLPLMNRVGHAYIKRRMAKENAMFAGEITGHYYFKDFFNADSGLMPAIFLLKILSESGQNQKLSQILSQFREKYFVSGEINVPLKDPVNATSILETLAKQCKDGRIYYMDGLSVEYPDWHFNVRASNTEPLIRLNLEALTQQKMVQKRDEILKIIKSF